MSSAGRAVVLLSGGLDSATVLAMARARGFACECLSVWYGQRHAGEIEAAGAVARSLGASGHRVVRVELGLLGGSALTDATASVPKDGEGVEEGRGSGGIPVTYVPARNLVFLSLAVGLAEAISSRDVFLGVNAVDYSGYPDCRPAFIEAFERVVSVGTREGVEGRGVRVHTPLAGMSKGEIVRTGVGLGVEYGLTRSCYDPLERGVEYAACGRCDSCRIRRKGFAEAGVADPTRYVV